MEYKCARCGETFETEWTDEEAKVEAKNNGFNIEDCDVVCDDCYKEIMVKIH